MSLLYLVADSVLFHSTTHSKHTKFRRCCLAYPRVFMCLRLNKCRGMELEAICHPTYNTYLQVLSLLGSLLVLGCYGEE